MLGFKCFLSVVAVALISSSVYATVLLDKVVAVVNQEVITWSELYRHMETDAAPDVKALSDEEKRTLFKENEDEFLETLIDIKLQVQEARNLGIKVSDEELNGTIESIKMKYSMTDAQFKESLKKEGYTYEEYTKRLREKILTSKVVNKQISSKILVSEKDIVEYLEENKDQGNIATSFRISQIFFKKPKNDDEKSKVEEKAEHVIKKIENGESFKDLAMQYSEDPSKNAGGDLGFIKKGHLMKEFSEVLSGLKPGEVSTSFWTEKGLHIIKLDEIVEPRDQQETKEEVRKLLSNKIYAKKYKAWIKGLRERSFIEIRL